MDDPETEALWEYVTTLTKAVLKLASATVQLVNDPRVLDRLQPLYEELRSLNKIYAEHPRAGVGSAAAGPSNDDLHNMIQDLAETIEEREAERERDRERPVHIRVIRR